MKFDRTRGSYNPDRVPEQQIQIPIQCPECRSKTIGTSAATITANTYWRCEACGAVWNEGRFRRHDRRR